MGEREVSNVVALGVRRTRQAPPSLRAANLPDGVVDQLVCLVGDLTPPERTLGFIDPSIRGYCPLYSSGTSCPTCTSRAWHVGRFSAECAHCGTALSLAPDAAPLVPCHFVDAH